jgi:hypothetical protein
MLIQASNTGSRLWIFLLINGVKQLLNLFQPSSIHKRWKLSRSMPGASLHPHRLGTHFLSNRRATFGVKQFEFLTIQPASETLTNHIPNGINTEHHKHEWTSIPIGGKSLTHLFVPCTRLQSFILICLQGNRANSFARKKREDIVPMK